MINLILKERIDNFKFITAQFAGSNQQYTYKTTMSLKEGDLIVVNSPSGLTVVTVANPDAEVVPSPKYPIKWVVDKVDPTEYKMLNRIEKELSGEEGVKRL